MLDGRGLYGCVRKGRMYGEPEGSRGDAGCMDEGCMVEKGEKNGDSEGR